MDTNTRRDLENIYSKDKNIQNKAFFSMLEKTEEPVDWAYESWDELVNALSHKDNHVRAISSQILCNLAKSDPEKRILKDFGALSNVTKDERFVTARHCLQSLWKVGAAGKEQQKMLMDYFDTRFRTCEDEKNYTLIRYDIIQGLRNLYDQVKDEKIREKSFILIDTEEDLKYRKKYASLWREK